MISELPPLSLYLHLPWCVQKCPYCDFNSHTAGAGTDKRRYIAALLADMEQESANAGDRTIESIFLGGGTPSFFSAVEIGEIVGRVASAFHLAIDAEITMEANPGTVERDSLSAYRRAGVNRLSLGAQSFDDRSLRRLGRIHGSSDIFDAWRDASSAGFDSINLDLMFALPGQTLEMAVADVEQVIALAPQHVSWYQLTLEPNTVFHARPPADLPDEELCWDIEERGHGLLSDAGYEQYEISAFARAGFRCRHNLNYWRFGDYLGIGAGAHGKITAADAIRRSSKPAHPLSYMKAIESGRVAAAPEPLLPSEIGFEYLLNALRLRDGFAEDMFVARTGLPFSVVDAGVRRARSLELLETDDDGHWKPTLRGTRFLNDLQALFLPDFDAESQRALSPQA